MIRRTNKRPKQSAPSKSPRYPAHRLAELHLKESTVSRAEIRSGQLPVNVQISVRAEAGTPADHDNVILCEISLSAAASYTEDGPAALHLKATFHLAYEFIESVFGLGPEGVRMFSQEVAAPEVWPYWREFAQSMTTRMGLPAIRLPLRFQDGGMVR
jgi:hypothetical protein